MSGYLVIVGGTKAARARWTSPRTFKTRASAKRAAARIHAARHMGVSTVWVLKANPHPRVMRSKCGHCGGTHARHLCPLEAGDCWFRRAARRIKWPKYKRTLAARGFTIRRALTRIGCVRLGGLSRRPLWPKRKKNRSR